MDIRFEFKQNLLDIQLVEYDHIVDERKGGYDGDSFLFSENRPALSLQPPHGRVAVECNEENIPLVFGFLEIPDMAHVDEVEAAVGQYDALPSFFFFGDDVLQLIECV